MKKITLGTVKEMMEWYDEAKNPKAQEIADSVSKVAEAAPAGHSKKEIFTQGVLFGYFLVMKGYIS